MPPEVLTDPRLARCIRMDARGNAVFPHWNRDGVCGYELKNHGFTGFAPGGEKGPWLSPTTDQDTALVITKSAIDALSHFAWRRMATYRYASIPGTLNHTQPELLRQAAASLPPGGGRKKHQAKGLAVPQRRPLTRGTCLVRDAALSAREFHGL